MILKPGTCGVAPDGLPSIVIREDGSVDFTLIESPGKASPNCQAIAAIAIYAIKFQEQIAAWYVKEIDQLRAPKH